MAQKPDVACELAICLGDFTQGSTERPLPFGLCRPIAFCLLPKSKVVSGPPDAQQSEGHPHD